MGAHVFILTASGRFSGLGSVSESAPGSHRHRYKPAPRPRLDQAYKEIILEINVNTMNYLEAAVDDYLPYKLFADLSVMEVCLGANNVCVLMREIVRSHAEAASDSDNLEEK